jgi:dihydrofolate reductase
MRPIGTHLYGRRMYETLVAWETIDTTGQSRAMQDFASLWRAADKIVYSRTLETASSAKTRIEPHFDADAVRRLKASAGHDLLIAGPELAGQAFEAGLVDECHLFLVPFMVGGGTRSLPAKVRVRLELRDEGRFDAGVVHLHYRIKT